MVHAFYDGISRPTRTTRTLKQGGVGNNSLDLVAFTNLATSNPANPDGLITTHTSWDKNSRLRSRTDDNGNTTTYVYDQRDRQVGVQAADLTMSTVVYDADSLPDKTLDRNGTVISNTYDGAHRLLRRQAQRLASDLEGTGQAVEGSTEQAFEYDGLNRLRVCFDNNGPGGDDVVTSYTYDSLSRPLTEEHQFGVIGRFIQTNQTTGKIQVFTGGSSISRTIQSQWDADSNRIGVTYSSGRQLTIQRDGLDRMQQVSDAGGVIAGWEFVGGRPVVCDTRNGVRTSYAYDQKRRVTGIEHQKNLGSGDRVVGFGYTWDRADRRTSETSLLAGFPGNPIPSLPTSVDTYTYDSAYRVTDVTRDRGRGDTSYQIDGVGNWASRTEGGLTQTFNQRNNGQNSPDLMNEYHRLLFFDATGLLTSEEQPVHDANGNRIQDSDYKLFFDLFDRLVRVERVSDGVTVGEYKYDCAGRRVYKRFLNPATGLQEETFFVCDGAQEVEELDGTGAVLADYVWGGLYVDQAVHMRRGGQSYYYHHNSVFSVAAVTDSSGAAVERYSYSYSSIYGVQQVLDGGGNARAPPQEIGNPWRFQGRRLDPETGFYYFRQRYLDPAQGRFVSRDPLGLWGSGGLGNPYAYCSNDPVNRVDPFGLEDKDRPWWSHLPIGKEYWEYKNTKPATTTLVTPGQEPIEEPDYDDTLNDRQRIRAFAVNTFSFTFGGASAAGAGGTIVVGLSVLAGKAVASIAAWFGIRGSITRLLQWATEAGVFQTLLDWIDPSQDVSATRTGTTAVTGAAFGRIFEYGAALVSRLLGRAKITVMGGAQEPSRVWPSNPEGTAARSGDEAIEIARNAGVDIGDDVMVVPFDDLPDDTFAAYLLPGTYRNIDEITWNMMTNRFGQVVIRVRPSVLKSDQAIIGVLAHEMHEIHRLRSMLCGGRSMSVVEFQQHTSPGSSGNLHDQAWDVSNSLIEALFPP